MRRDPPGFEIPPEAVDAACPHCGARNTELESLFGSSVSEVMLRCRACQTIFHWVKWVDVGDDEHASVVASAQSERT